MRKLLTCRCVKTTPFGDHFPPKSRTRHYFGDHFPPKAQHGTVLGMYISPQKPTRRRFRDQLSHQIAHVGPAFFLSFLVYFFLILVWFKWINGFGLFFWQSQMLIYYILLYNMGYHMTMGLGFLITLYYGLSYDNGFRLFK